MLHKLISQSHWSLPLFGNKPKKFDFVHQTVSCWEVCVGWAQDYQTPSRALHPFLFSEKLVTAANGQAFQWLHYH